MTMLPSWAETIVPVKLLRPSMGWASLHDGLLTGVTREMLLRAQRAVDARRGHLQGVGSGERVERIHDVVDPCLRFRQLIEAHALGRVYELRE